MATYIRQGDCNQCGQCCGAPSVNYPEGVQPWGATLPCGYSPANDHGPGYLKMAYQRYPELANRQGSANVKYKGTTYYAIWDCDLKTGICKDLPPYGDLNTRSNECPFLADDPGDGTRPCGVEVFDDPNICGVVPTVVDERHPPTPEQWIADWHQRYPECSYTWVLQP